MRQFLTAFFLLFVLNPIFGQKSLAIPETSRVTTFMESLPKKLEELKLIDLRKSTDSINIRIWQSQEVFTISVSDSTFANYKIHVGKDDLIMKSYDFSEQISRKILDSLSLTEVMDLENDEYRGIDGWFVFIEIATKSSYKVVSFWSPKAERSDDGKILVESLSMIDKAINSSELRGAFQNSLPVGGYRWGRMSSFSIDRFISKENAKTDFYSRAEERIKKELNITKDTNHWEYPIVFINNEPAKIADLNRYTEQEVSKFEILTPDHEKIFMYGDNGSNGVVKLETK